jgi:hypothetical protein
MITTLNITESLRKVRRCCKRPSIASCPKNAHNLTTSTSNTRFTNEAELVAPAMASVEKLGRFLGALAAPAGGAVLADGATGTFFVGCNLDMPRRFAPES